MVMRQNGDYYGLFTFVEDTDDQYLMVGPSSLVSVMPQLVSIYAHLTLALDSRRRPYRRRPYTLTLP